MSALATTTPRLSTGPGQLPADDGLGLLLDLFAFELALEAPAPWPPADGSRAGLRARLQGWCRRAALWGAGPQGAWRAW